MVFQLGQLAYEHLSVVNQNLAGFITRTDRSLNVTGTVLYAKTFFLNEQKQLQSEPAKDTIVEFYVKRNFLGPILQDTTTTSSKGKYNFQFNWVARPLDDHEFTCIVKVFGQEQNFLVAAHGYPKMKSSTQNFRI